MRIIRGKLPIREPLNKESVSRFYGPGGEISKKPFYRQMRTGQSEMTNKDVRIR